MDLSWLVIALRNGILGKTVFEKTGFLMLGYAKGGQSANRSGLAVTVPILLGSLGRSPFCLGGPDIPWDSSAIFSLADSFHFVLKNCGDHRYAARLCVGRLALEKVDDRAVRYAIFTGCHSM